MRKYLILILPALLIGACKDDETTPVNTADIGELNNGVTTCQYAPYTTGSTFTYEQQTAFGTQTATWTVGGDRIIDNRQFIQVSGMLGLSSTVYFNCENGEYTIWGENIPSIVGALELIYLKENVTVNTQWSKTISQSYGGLNYQTQYDFTYAGEATSRTVRGVTYQDIIEVHLEVYTNITGSFQLFSEDNYYWAEGVGLIEAIGTSANFELVSYNIQ